MNQGNLLELSRDSTEVEKLETSIEKCLKSDELIYNFQKVILGSKEFLSGDYAKFIEEIEKYNFRVKLESELVSKKINISYDNILLHLVQYATNSFIDTILEKRNSAQDDKIIEIGEKDNNKSIKKENATDVLDLLLYELRKGWNGTKPFDVDSEFNIGMVKEISPSFFLVKNKYLIDKDNNSIYTKIRNFGEYIILENSLGEKAIYTNGEIHEYNYSINDNMDIFHTKNGKKICHCDVLENKYHFPSDNKSYNIIGEIVKTIGNKILIQSGNKKFLYDYEKTTEIESEHNIDGKGFGLFISGGDKTSLEYTLIDLKTLEEKAIFDGISYNDLLVNKNEVREKKDLKYLGEKMVDIEFESTRNIPLDIIYNIKCVINNDQLILFKKVLNKFEKLIEVPTQFFLNKNGKITLIEEEKHNGVKLYIKNTSSFIKKLFGPERKIETSNIDTGIMIDYD